MLKQFVAGIIAFVILTGVATAASWERGMFDDIRHTGIGLQQVEVEAANIFYSGVEAYERSDYDEAVRLFRLAAELGVESAQYNLGLMYYDGDGVPQDYAEARKWFRLAAEQGDPSSQSNLALMYAEGQGVPPDLIKAHMWWNIAGARQKSYRVNRDIAASHMTPDQIAEAQRMAREWKPVAER